MSKEKVKRWNWNIIYDLKPITRKDAKYYAKSCEICKEMYDSKKPLFYVYWKTFETENIKADLERGNFTNSTHIFTLEELNKWLYKHTLSPL